MAEYAIGVLQFIPGAVFSALRAYVLSRSKLLILPVLALSLAPVAANLVVYGYELSGENFPPFGCLEIDNTPQTVVLRLVISSRVPLVIADVLLVYITWTKLSGRGTLRDLQQSKRLSLSDILFCDGTIYFVVLFILNVLHLVFSLTALAVENGTSYVTAFTGPLTAILVSRFLLDLQEANQAVVRVDPDDPFHSSRDPYDTPSFISSLGAFINPELAASADDVHDSELHDLSRSDEEEGDSGQASQAASSTSSPCSA